MTDIQIMRMLEQACCAPSAKNSQPWRFELNNGTLSIIDTPEASTWGGFYEGYVACIAHGALIENIVLLSQAMGFDPKIDLFPDNRNHSVAVMTFVPVSPVTSTLTLVIPTRTTNRKQYSGGVLSSDLKDYLTEYSSAEYQLKIIDDTRLEDLAKAVAVGDRLFFENPILHEFLYNSILWKEQDQLQKAGFFIDTFEFMPHQLKGVRLFKYWPILSMMNKLVSVSAQIGNDNESKYKKSGSIAAIVMQGDTAADYVRAGRCLQRIWLAATIKKLAVHPCTAILYFHERILRGDTKTFNTAERGLIEAAYQTISGIFSATGYKIPMLFRVGYAEAPSARAIKRSPQLLLNQPTAV